jgi:hypothetical protein
MYYECDLNGFPVSCQLIEWHPSANKCLVEYTDKVGLLRLWIDSARIKERVPSYDVSQ